ncbi:TonB-dependent receptor [Niabella yanshanensis]|uniref:TonB-dependent receptor n=1 Tax=Niabella yanshanensis TaxID=577386 RepID=A0ABZ0W2T8_9BACT|nr:TonB-dependent receptor [Niabella yanshanensis]WQD37580.1 TonB-dependent receptor [Niabella yanshanensis]
MADDGGGIIKGKIVDADQNPVRGASIGLLETPYATYSDAGGNFEIKGLATGKYVIRVTFVGFKPYDEALQVNSEKVTFVKISLQKEAESLSEVTVVSGINRFNKKETDNVARLPLRNIENPQVYSVIPKEIIAEQVLVDYNSIFKNIPGAAVPVVYNQGRSAMLSRGFTTANFIRNSISGFVYTNIDPANLEVLQAIKGPSGTLFNSGQISFGGLFNRVTKKPLENNKTEIAFTGGSYNLNRLTFDVNRPLTNDKQVLFRINGAVHTEKSFQDQGFSRNIMLAPSFIYKLNDRLDFLLDIEASMYNATSPIRFAPSVTATSVKNIRDLGMDYKRSFLTNSLDYNTQQVNFFGQINYALSGNWKLQTNITRTFSTTKGYVTQLIGVNDSMLRQRAQKENFPYNGVELQQNLIGDFEIGTLRNRIVVGIDYYNQRSDRNTPTVTLPAINFKKPGTAYANFNADKVDSAAARVVPETYATNVSNYSAYVSNVLNITSRFNVMLSLRLDHVDNKGRYDVATAVSTDAFNQAALSPKLGIVYEMIKDKLSLFGNYMNGFDYNAGSDSAGNPFKPQQANQWEIGFKTDLFHHRLTGTISYYDIAVKNILRLAPGGVFNIQDGMQISRGFEAEIIANPVDGLNLITGYTYNDSKLTNAAAHVDGLRPAASGPMHLANFWISYRIVSGKAKGLGAGLGGNYGSASYQTNTHKFKFEIPAYTVFDATAFYDFVKCRVGLKLDNLTNEQYWSFRLAPQMPRRLSANLVFRF